MGRTAPYPLAFIPARRSDQPWLFWSQVAGRAFAALIILTFDGAVLFSAVRAHA